MNDITISAGFRPDERPQIAALYWQAFGGKLSKLLNPDEKALQFIEAALTPEFALCARDRTGALLGAAGFKTADGALVGGGLAELAAVYGWFGALWRGLLLGALERDLAEGLLLMDGIFVTQEARGKGIGTKLLTAIKAHARDKGLSEVRLDVINTNPRAKALYIREGFEPRKTTHIGPFKYLFGFESSEELYCDVTR